MPRSTSTSGSSICSYYTARSDYDTTDDYYSNLPVTSTELRTRTGNPGTWPLRSRRTDPRLSERTTRGYNPSYYGDIAPIAGSSPALTDVGYRIESLDTPPVGTPMGDRYRQYKSYDVDAYDAEQEYNDRFKEVPKAPRKKHKTEDYKGDPPMTLNHHRRLAPYAENMVDVTCRHIDTRSEYDHDYVGHYSGKAHRKGHTDRIMQEERREERLRRKDDEHRRFVHGEDEAYQEEAKEERIRAKKEKHKRMGYERSEEDD